MGRRQPLPCSPRQAGLFRTCRVLIMLGLLATVSGGCRTSSVLPIVEDSAEYYEAESVEMEPVSSSELLLTTDVQLAEEPRRLRHEEVAAPWPLTLDEAIQHALHNSDVIRSAGQLGSPSNPILANPEGVRSAYDPAIQQRGYLFGQRGVEAALSDFDAQFTTGMTWGREEQIQNNNFLAGGLNPGDTLASDTAQYNSALTKSLITGGQVSLNHQWNYGSNNSTQRLFTSAYDGNLGLQFRQPLLAGAGIDYTRIAGPISGNANNITGLTQGIVIARINEDISIIEFELALTSLVRDVETQYWQLAIAQQSLALEEEMQAKTRLALHIAQSRRTAGGLGSGALEETAAREQYQQSLLQVAAARDQLYTTEAELRRILGLSVNDGRLLQTIDDPVTADMTFDWHHSLGSALIARPELRKQKWHIRSLQLQLQAAENLLRPQLDFVSDYHTNGFGDDLLGPRNDGVTNKGLGSGYGTLFSGQQTGWTLGVEYSIPLRQRLAKTRLQGLELQLAKSQALLRVQEVEISHELAAAFREIDRTWLAAEVHTARLATAEERLNALKALSKSTPDRVSIEEILRAQRAVADARRDILTSYTEYTLAITTLQQRTGGLLPAHNISLYDHAIQPHPIEYFRSLDSNESIGRAHLTDDQAPAPGLLPVR